MWSTGWRALRIVEGGDAAHTFGGISALTVAFTIVIRRGLSRVKSPTRGSRAEMSEAGTPAPTSKKNISSNYRTDFLSSRMPNDSTRGH
jgi:hypothetical protein